MPVSRVRLSWTCAAIAAGAISTGCGRTPRVQAPEPVADSSADVSVPTLPPSRLDVPITADLGPVLADLERVVPRAFGDMDDRRSLGSNDRIDFAFEAERSRFNATLIGETARLTASIRYRVRAWYNPPIAPTISASCGTSDDRDDRPTAFISVSSRLRIDSDWTLRSHLVVDTVRPADDEPANQCRITALRIDATDRVLRAARSLLESEGPKIDAAVAGLDLRSHFQEWWDLIRTPIPLSDSVWLLVEPLEVRRGEVGGRGHELHATVGLTAQPRIVIGPRPAAIDRPLPELQEGEVEPGLHILVEGQLEYETISHFLNEQFVGRTFESRGHAITIRDLRLSGLGRGRLALRVQFSGDAIGHVYLVGTPDFDTSSGLVEVPDLDFELASSSLLVEGLDWLRHDEFVGYIRQLARWPVEDAIAEGTRLLLSGLNRNLSQTVQLSGEVEHVVPLAVVPTVHALRIQAHAHASARLVVR